MRERQALQTATSAARYYCEARHDGSLGNTQRVETPTACAAFPKELMFTPRRWVETRFNLTRCTIMPRGGHFAALDEDERLICARACLDRRRLLDHNGAWRDMVGRSDE